MKNKITVTGANKLFFVFVILFVLFQIILIFLSAIYGQDIFEKRIYEILLVNQYILILIPVLLYVIINKLDFKEVFRLNRLKIVPAVLIAFSSVFAYFAASFINTLVVYLLQFIGNIPSQPIPAPQNLYELAIGILVVAVSPAICEEALHRGIMLSAYEKRGTKKAIVITSIIFGFFHFDITNLLGPIFLGMLIGYYVVRTNSIYAGMLAHFLNNAIAEVLQFFFRNEVSAGRNITVKLSELGELAVWGAMGMLALYFLLKAFRRVTEDSSIIKPSLTGVKNDFASIFTHWPIISALAIYLLLLALSLLAMIIDKNNLLK
ncbi:MAG: CPBP family intramembrane metalloprotease [Clostridia bacterium]|nr:CPBP family intramembrane metalloprotease [Clostridia bacterium]